MPNIDDLIEGLQSSDHNHAYECLKQLIEISSSSNEVYAYFDLFAEMMDSDNSYSRTRGILLISANAKWDIHNKIDEIIDEYLKHIVDDKPITSRQCIKALPALAAYKPELKEVIQTALLHANITKYKDSMKPLVQKDIQESLQEIDKL